MNIESKLNQRACSVLLYSRYIIAAHATCRGFDGGELYLVFIGKNERGGSVLVNPFSDTDESARQLEAIRYWLMTNKPEEYFATPDEPGDYTCHDYMIENVKSILMRM